MYDCVTGQRIPDNFGCIMADEMVFTQMTQLIKCLNLFYLMITLGEDEIVMDPYIYERYSFTIFRQLVTT